MKIIISCCPGLNEVPFGPVKPKQSEDGAFGRNVKGVRTLQNNRQINLRFKKCFF